MHLLAIPLLLFCLLFGPSWWIRWVLRKHATPLPGCRWSGAELAEHLLLRKGIQGVTVRLSPLGDHYDPSSRSVNLSQDHFHGRSLTALTVAAHEVGHALQHADGDRKLALRTALVERATGLEKLLPWVVGVLAVLALVIRIPAFFLLVAVLFLISLALRTLTHVVTLPVEWDASFGRALPMLEETGVIHPRDTPAARRILTAAALTYVSASLASALRLSRWFRMLRV